MRRMLALLTLLCACDAAPAKLSPEQYAALSPPSDVVESACPTGEACDDGDPCTGPDECAAGACAGLELTCDDGVPCTTDACDPGTGCASQPVDAACDDGVACTTDSCDAILGCAHAPADGACDDGFPCTADSCTSKGCAHAPDDAACDDDEPCTTDACTVSSGCAHVPAAGPCDDGDLCTDGDACAGGVCVAGGPALCDDGNACTTDACSPEVGCTATESCDDGDPCTADSCDESEGCSNTAIAGCEPPLDGWAGARRVRIFEPTHDTGGTVLSLIGSHYASGDSGFRRVDEVVEVPLVTGLLADVVLYLPMDGSLHNEVGDDLIATDDGAVFEPGRYGEALLPVGKVVLSPPPPDGTSFTLAFWARPPAGATGAIEVVGFYPPSEGAPAGLPLTVRYVQGGFRVSLGQGLPINLGAASGGWQHIGITWDSEAQEGRIFVDGRGAVPFTTAPAFQAAPLILGPPAAGPADPKVAVDDLIYASRSLDASEMAALRRAERPFGAPLVPAQAQADWDDVRVTLAGQSDLVPHDVVGRRPHGDSGSALAGVAVCWPLDGDLAPSVGEAVSLPGAMESVRGAFGDAGGALRPLDGATRLWADRSTNLAAPFSVELWVRLDDPPVPCEGEADGAVLLQSAFGDSGATQGFVLRVCDGAVRFELRDGDGVTAVSGTRSIGDGRWHHVLASVDGSARLFVDGAPEGDVVAVAGLADALHAISLGASPDGAVTGVALDDVCIHTVAKAAAHAYGRVWPPVPTVRFAVSTTGDAVPYDVPPVAIHVGNPTVALAPPGDGCDDLRSCLGTVGLWTFDRRIGPSGVLTPDEVGGRHATRSGEPLAVPGADGSALALFGGWFEVPEGLPALTAWTVEAVVRPAVQAGRRTVVSAGDTEEGLSVVLDGTTLEHGVVGGSVALGAAGQTSVWSNLGGSGGGGALTAFDDEVELTEEVESPPLPPLVPLWFAKSPDPDPSLLGAIDTVRVSDRERPFEERLKTPALTWIVE